MAIDTKKVVPTLTQDQIERYLDAEASGALEKAEKYDKMQADIGSGKIAVVKENKQVIDGWTISVGDVEQKIKDGKPDSGVSGGLVNIRGNGSNGLPLSNRPSLNIETVLHIIKNAKQYKMFLLQDHQQYRQSGQKLDAHQFGDALVTVDKLVQEGFLSRSEVPST